MSIFVSEIIPITFFRVGTTRTHALHHQRHTIAPALMGALSPAQLPATRGRHVVAASIFNLIQGYYPRVITSCKSAHLMSIDETNSPPSIQAQQGIHIRPFRTVADYHSVADETLNNIQDAVEDYLEENYDAGAVEKEEDMPEVNNSSGVLTLYLPPHGTWIINKQSPNQQLWWSSPISGPRRYEYDKAREIWVYSRVVDEVGAGDAGEVSYNQGDTLEGILNKEFEDLFGEGLGDGFLSPR